MKLHQKENLFFDLDHTLWDYDTSARQTLEELYNRYDIASKSEASVEQLVASFFVVNEDLWDKYNKGQISKYYLRTERFKLVFDGIELSRKIFSEKEIEHFGTDYLYECPNKPNLISGAIELLEKLSGQFRMHIITNGFNEVQGTKIRTSGLQPYFEHIITSERAGSKKPSSSIFQFAIDLTDSSVNSSLMIGDNLHTDMKGARDFGMDQVFFNPENKHHNDQVTFEIQRLEQLLDLLSIRKSA